MSVPLLTTERILVRPLVMDDLDAVYQAVDVELNQDCPDGEWPLAYEVRRGWLEWTIRSYGELERLKQPPYGERAVVLKETQALIGLCGFVPCLNAFGLLPSLATGHPADRLYSTEFGLFYALSPRYHRKGYATEAARALADYALTTLKLKRVVATTTRTNHASIGVMRKLGMRIDTNPNPEPPWLQVVGILDNSP